MQTQPEEDLFEVKLTVEGVSSLQNNSRQIGLLFVLGIVGALFMLVYVLFNILKYAQMKGTSYDWYYKGLYPALFLMDVILVFLQLMAYRNFGRLSAKALEEKDTEQFNRSFSHLLRYTRLAIVHLYLIMIIYAIAIYFLIHTLIGSSHKIS